MKAVIMAGGEGTRLRPLTCTAPKPMARLFGRPLIEYILDLLYRNDTGEAVITLGYMPDIIEKHFEDGFKGMKLSFLREEEPLGTAGGVKNAAESFKEPFFVVSGDALCDFQLEKIMLFHQASGAAVTIVACEAQDPREYGVIKVADDNRVLGFVEKPSWAQATSRLINTGVYIINPECLNLIPPNKSFDFAKDLFPAMLEKNMPIFCYREGGYWCDIGNIDAYLECHNDVFDGKTDILPRPATKDVYVKNELPSGNYSIVPPVYIGSDCEIARDAVIGPYAVIDDSVYIGENARVRNCVVLENSSIAAEASLTGALVCAGVSLKKGAAMFEGSVAGSGAVIGANAAVKPGISVWPGKIIGSGAVVNSNVKYGCVRADILDDSGVSEASGAQLTAESCVKLGAAVGSTRQGKKAGVAFDGTSSAKVMHMAVTAGLMSAGSRVWNFSDCFEAQLNFFVNFCGLGTGLFVVGGENKAIKICGESGLSIPRSFERDIEARMAKCEFRTAAESEIRPCSDMSAVKTLYKQEIIRQAPCGLGNVGCTVTSDNETIEFIMQDILSKLNCNEKKTPLFHINNAGTAAYAVLESGERVDFERLLALCCYNEIKNGRDIAVPYDAPQFLDAIGESYGRQVYRYLSSPADNSDSNARRLAAKQPFVRDALFMAVKLLSIMNERDLELEILLKELPQCYIIKKVLPFSLKPSELSGIVGEETVSVSNNREGVQIVRDGGHLLIIPERNGENLRILAQAASMEAASELCDGIEELISAAENERNKNK